MTNLCSLPANNGRSLEAWPDEKVDTAAPSPLLGHAQSSKADRLRTEILDLVGQYYQVAFAPKVFCAADSPVPVAGRVFDEADVKALVDSALDFWLTAGRFSDRFETEFARVFRTRF